MTETGIANIPSVLEAAHSGYLSDPEDISLYEQKDVDDDGLPLYRCLRGTNAVEGMHSHINRFMAMYNGSPYLSHLYISTYRHHHKCNVGHDFRSYR